MWHLDMTGVPFGPLAVGRPAASTQTDRAADKSHRGILGAPLGASLRSASGHRIGRFSRARDGERWLHRWEWLDGWPTAAFTMTPHPLEALAGQDVSVEVGAPFLLPIGPHSVADRLVGARQVYRITGAHAPHRDASPAWLAVRDAAIDWFETGEADFAQRLPVALRFEPCASPSPTAQTRHWRQRCPALGPASAGHSPAVPLGTPPATPTSCGGARYV